MRGFVGSVLLAGYCVLFDIAASVCVPDVPRNLISEKDVLEHEAVVQALEKIHDYLSKKYSNGTTRDGLSVAIVHASSPKPIYTFNNGTLKFNETSTPDAGRHENIVTSDSIFRVNSITKTIAVTSALVISQKLRQKTPDGPFELTLDSPVRRLLPSFALQPRDWADGGSDITLRMLASHTAGIPRESYSTGFNMVLGTSKADADTIGARWAGQSAEALIEGIARKELMFVPGQRAAYSNAGIGLLGAAVAAYYGHVTGSDLPWSDLATQEILKPLNMTHSFFGTVPQHLIRDLTIPGGENWADLIVGEGYDPAAGMWSSANDLANYLYKVWLAPEPELITQFQRRDVLRPSINIPDSVQQTGPGWEIGLHNISTNDNNSSKMDTFKQYSVYGKPGGGGGWKSWIDNVPNLGYGIIILAQQSGLKPYESIAPAAVQGDIHSLLLPAFSKALSDRVRDQYAGRYTTSMDTGLVTNQVDTGKNKSLTYAQLEVQDQILYLRSLVVGGKPVLEAIDRLFWTADEQPILFSKPQGAVLEPAEGAAETAQFGAGAQVWRMSLPGAECNWQDFDGVQDNNGWPLTKIVTVTDGDRVELHYPPFNIVTARL